MKNLYCISFKNKGQNFDTKYLLYFYPTTRNSVRLFVVDTHKGCIVDKLGIIKRSFKSNEVEVILKYSSSRRWLSAGLRLSFDNYFTSLKILGNFGPVRFG